MKINITSALSYCLFLLCSTHYAQKNAGEYLQKINTEFGAISAEMWDYTSAVAHGKKARTVENKRKELIGQITASTNKIKHMPAFEGNAAYRDSAVSYLKLNKIVLNEDYAKIVDMEEVAEQSYDAMEAYMLVKEKADDKIKAAGEMIEIEEAKFASENGINLIESKDKIGKKLAEAGKVYKYYNEIYLIFFKSYKQEMFLIDAQNKADFNAMEQNKNALAKNSVDGQQRLAVIKDYKGDQSVKNACMDMLKFYESEATKKYDDISGFYLEKEKFDKIRAAFEAKKASQRTQQDSDQYNLAVNDYNASSNKYNKTNNELNDTRTRLLDKWNNASSKFTDKHVPKKK